MKEQKLIKNTSSFNLTASFDGKTLSLSLHDFVTTIKYEGRFTSKDTNIIHRKADFKDICDSLFAPKQTDETMMENQGNTTKGF